MYLGSSGGGDGRRGSEATERGRGGGGIPLPYHGVFALWGFKVSDLVHTFGAFVGILFILKLIGKYMFTKYVSSSSGGGMTGEEAKRPSGVGGVPPPTPGSFCILGFQTKRSGAYF